MLCRRAVYHCFVKPAGSRPAGGEKGGKMGGGGMYQLATSRAVWPMIGLQGIWEFMAQQTFLLV